MSTSGHLRASTLLPQLSTPSVYTDVNLMVCPFWMYLPFQIFSHLWENSYVVSWLVAQTYCFRWPGPLFGALADLLYCDPWVSRFLSQTKVIGLTFRILNTLWPVSWVIPRRSHHLFWSGSLLSLKDFVMGFSNLMKVPCIKVGFVSVSYKYLYVSTGLGLFHFRCYTYRLNFFFSGPYVISSFYHGYLFY